MVAYSFKLRLQKNLWPCNSISTPALLFAGCGNGGLKPRGGTHRPQPGGGEHADEAAGRHCRPAAAQPHGPWRDADHPWRKAADPCPRILRSHDDALAELSGRSLSGTLRFGCPDDYADAFLPALLRSFAALHPQVIIEVVCASTPAPGAAAGPQCAGSGAYLVPLTSSRPVLRQEEIVWVGLKSDDGLRSEPLRLALGDPDTLDHRGAIAALERTGRAYQLAIPAAACRDCWRWCVRARP